jgi:hypothetical protein
MSWETVGAAQPAVCCNTEVVGGDNWKPRVIINIPSYDNQKPFELATYKLFAAA